MSGGLVPIDQNRPADLSQAVHFGHNFPISAPATPGAVTPDVALVREFFSDKLQFPDGAQVDYWAFKDPAEDKPFPSTPIRVRQHQTVHTTVHVAKNAHTIHHHGIEPSTFNDGVPDTSFAVNPQYTYQWRPSRAGTFFYHCHRNTPLHFQMGMFGYLIVDPPSGPGLLRDGGPTYDVEALWAVYDIDPFWRTYNHAAGEAHAEAGVRLNRFNPRYFTVNGVTTPDAAASPKTTVHARVGQTVLLRHLTGAYFPVRVTFPPQLQATIVGTDGTPLARGPFRTDTLTATTAERYELTFRPTSPGTYPVSYQFLAYYGSGIAGTATAYVIVS